MGQRAIAFMVLCACYVPVRADIPAMYHAVANYHGVPVKLLYAVATVESGRDNGEEGLAPWPWTINVNGQGVYFDSRETLFEAVMHAISDGDVVDIGLMQLNWHWKFDRLVSPWQATDPFFNLQVAGAILKEHFDNFDDKDWFQAAGRYHREADTSRAREARQRYQQHVRRAWDRLN